MARIEKTIHESVSYSMALKSMPEWEAWEEEVNEDGDKYLITKQQGYVVYDRDTRSFKIERIESYTFNTNTPWDNDDHIETSFGEYSANPGDYFHTPKLEKELIYFRNKIKKLEKIA